MNDVRRLRGCYETVTTDKTTKIMIWNILATRAEA